MKKIKEKIDLNIEKDLNNLKKQKEIAIKKTKKLTNDYKKFALRGNIIDLAVGVALGSAFNNIVNTIVSNFVTPLLGLVTNNVDIGSLYITLDGQKYESLEVAKNAGALVINYGSLVNAVLNFFFISIVLFFFLRYATKVKEKLEDNVEEENNKITKTCPHCFSNINIEATKCAFCTSDLKTIQDEN